jgi:hypothetical protein
LHIENLLNNQNWKVFDLKMTKQGFDNFSDKIISLNESRAQIYVHVSIGTILPNEVLRIGSAKNGIVERWVKGTNGHGSTFLYSIGESERYKNSARKYQNYLIFFAELKGLNTKLCVLDCKTTESMKKIEKELIKYFNPIWEQFKKPIKIYLKENQDIKETASLCGGAMEIINKNFSNIPNILNFNSHIKWQQHLKR